MHYTEDELILHFYGESSRRATIDRHLDECRACASLYTDLAATLKLVVPPAAPERDERYGLEVWQRLRPVLPVQPPVHVTFWQRWNALALGGAIAALIVTAFFIGRAFPPAPSTSPASTQIAQSGVTPSSGNATIPVLDAGARVRMAAIGDHLDRSERLLLDVLNAGNGVDLTAEQDTASELIDSSRFYRSAATSAGDAMVAEVLDDLERSLLEIAHGPSTLTREGFEDLRKHLEAAALLFKVRVLSDELHERERATPRKTT